MLTAVSILIAAQVYENPKSGTRFIGLPGLDFVYRDSGPSELRMKPVEPSKLMFHELVYVARDRGGNNHYRLDGKQSVMVAMDEEKVVVPIVETKELVKVRRRFQGRQVWSYGGWNAWHEFVNPRQSNFTRIEPGQSLKIKAIYQLAKVPIAFRKTTEVVRCLNLSGSFTKSDYKKESAFLVIYSQDRSRGDNASIPYNIFLGSWYLDQLFSLTPPPRSALSAIRKAEAERDVEKRYLGMTPIQVAWSHGWPITRKPLSQMLKAPIWSCGDHWSIEFKNGKVAKYFRSMPH